MSHHESIETQLPAGSRLATHEEAGWGYRVVTADGSETVWITDAPDPLVEAMGSFFDGLATPADEQRTIGSLGLVRA